ncbi:MAG TPA: ACT domain-containing protein [Candidatus Sulfotelmatobacter sp.]
MSAVSDEHGPPHQRRQQLKFRQLRGSYAIVRLAPKAEIPAWATSGEFTSVTRTADEISVVCSAKNIPEDISSGPRWTCLKLEGPFLFSQTGILLSFIQPLSGNGVPIFAVSTYDTDYVLIQEEHMSGVVELLRKAGHELLQ